MAAAKRGDCNNCADAAVIRCSARLCDV